MDKSDEELVLAYRAGEAEALNELVRRHLNGVYTFSLRFAGGEQEAEDIAQETFVKAWHGISSYNPAASKFKTWLLRIARNTAIDFLRKRKNVPFSQFESEGVNVLAETISDESESPEEALAREGDAAEVMAALVTLAPRHREVLLLYYTNQGTFEEIGQMLGEPSNTVKSRHRRAIQALREALLEARTEQNRRHV